MNHEIIYAVVGYTFWENHYECEFCFKLYKKKEDAEKEAKELNDMVKAFPKYDVDEHNNIIQNEKSKKYDELYRKYMDFLMESIHKGNETLGDIDYPPMEWNIKEVKVFS